MMANVSVEVLIPVYKPGAEFKQLLKKLEQQTCLPESVHLLITASQEEFGRLRKEIAEEIRNRKTEYRFTRIEPAQFDHGGTRHLGASMSQADVLLFMTQDAVPDDEYLVEQLVYGLYPERKKTKENQGEQQKRGEPESRGAETAAVYARQLPAGDCNPIERYTRQFNYPDRDQIKTAADLPRLGIKTYFCSNVCAAYRRDIYEKQGGFERRTIFNEDMIFAAGLIKAGFAIAYAADARVVHSHNYSGLQQLHRNFDLAVSQAEHPEIFRDVPSEGEGIRMVKSAAAYLCGTGRFYLLPKLVWQSGCKYLGYLLGKRYRKLPKSMIMRLTMNRRYWR